MKEQDNQYELEWKAEVLHLTTKSATTGWIIAAIVIPFFSFFELSYSFHLFFLCLFLFLGVSMLMIFFVILKRKYTLPSFIANYGVSIIVALCCSCMAAFTHVGNVHKYLMAVSTITLVRGLFYFGRMSNLIVVTIINHALIFSFILLGRNEALLEIPAIGSTLFFGIMFMLFAFAGMNNRYKLTKENFTNALKLKTSLEIIEEKNKEITSSITYAQRIQQAILPNKEEIYATLPNSFILFKPKDIVSGDFYFFHQNREVVFIAAADCTGHGVPGALMSMIGSEKLNEAVLQSNDPSVILTQLNRGIKSSLRQEESEESTRDGMDIALCTIDPKTLTVKYAGANRPIWVIRKGQVDVEEIKATKKSIGGLTGDDEHFETHELTLQTGDTFYICTDGYHDQDGGDKGKKLMTKNLKQLLLDIQHLSMHEQEKHLEEFAGSWRGAKEQLDDILVIGVRV